LLQEQLLPLKAKLIKRRKMFAPTKTSLISSENEKFLSSPAFRLFETEIWNPAVAKPPDSIIWIIKWNSYCEWMYNVTTYHTRATLIGGGTNSLQILSSTHQDGVKRKMGASVRAREDDGGRGREKQHNENTSSLLYPPPPIHVLHSFIHSFISSQSFAFISSVFHAII
jgi:hypothetical protein